MVTAACEQKRAVAQCRMQYMPPLPSYTIVTTTIIIIITRRRAERTC